MNTCKFSAFVPIPWFFPLVGTERCWGCLRARAQHRPCCPLHKWHRAFPGEQLFSFWAYCWIWGNGCNCFKYTLVVERQCIGEGASDYLVLATFAQCSLETASSKPVFLRRRQPGPSCRHTLLKNISTVKHCQKLLGWEGSLGRWTGGKLLWLAFREIKNCHLFHNQGT